MPQQEPIRLFGLGLGPGDPDYMTVRARKLLETADRLVHFCKRGRRGNARTIADAIVGQDPEREIALAYPVTIEIPADHPDYAAALNPFYEEAAARLLAEVEAGRTIGVLCEGDPFFYGSFMHLWWRLKDRIPIEVVPAVTAMSGAWTRAGAPITWGDDVLTIVPGTLPEAELARRLSGTDAAVVMKLGSHLPKVRTVLKSTGLFERAIYVERATMAEERIVPLPDLPEDWNAPYFSLIIVPGQGRRV
ncbi:precorrin-2 C(20)-methyltransferase [Microvirga lotononidis]|uniref:Precorrin-2 C20-methyltransferase n=1 Tax=Microvirga lotononidis TaxID=864069 RepID=I4YWT7_9HYPH|nr:precorrin-2 C(20)-methyltransferase [Microvirga lotononidis]EIM28429.1 precorrin-2 C20-methyltransferase [Microvirga lotononidis]WQO27491.1 precorrin-2 C(20)-methyltransferase [Microvirga lotononidis]